MAMCSIAAALPRYSRESLGWRLLEPLERAAAAAALCALLPLLVGIAAAIILLSRRSPLVAHRRVGRHGLPFWTLKFRTMWRSGGAWNVALVERIVDGSGPKTKRARDPRVTSRFARFCRRYSIDELPQLANVVLGDMSLVGPRPLTEGELRSHYAGAIGEVLSVKPGITGLWQVRGRSRLSYAKRRSFDLQLVRSRSARLYCTILLRTVPEVIGGRNSW